MVEFITPRGMRDFLPEEMSFRSKVMDKIRAVFESYGFDPACTPAIEYLNVLEAKKAGGEELTSQTFEIEDMGLRYDQTVGMARMVANNSLPKPFKRYSIAPVWRREEPQYGRSREFWQADIDTLGSDSLKCEAEILACAYNALKSIGIKSTIYLNNRETIQDILAKAGIKEEQMTAAMRILDKLKKKGKTEVEKEMLEKGISKTNISKIFDLITSDSKDFKGLDKLNEIVDLCKDYGIKNIKIDYSLIRGFAYYTGPVFEFEGEKGEKNIGSIAGGGRYDNLLSLYGSPSPAVGLGLGLERIFEILKPEKFERKTDAKIYVAVIKKEFYNYAISIAQELRENGIPVSMDLTDRNLRKQLDYANSLGVPFLAVIGEKEMKDKKITLRDMKSGKEEFISAKDAVKLIV
jgi:histidyl-tRNA synthetase